MANSRDWHRLESHRCLSSEPHPTTTSPFAHRNGARQQAIHMLLVVRIRGEFLRRWWQANQVEGNAAQERVWFGLRLKLKAVLLQSSLHESVDRMFIGRNGTLGRFVKGPMFSPRCTGFDPTRQQFDLRGGKFFLMGLGGGITSEGSVESMRLSSSLS